MTDFPDLKIKALVSFPAAILDGAGIDVVKSNGSYQFNLDYGDFAPPVGGISDPAHENALLWNSLTNSYVLVPVSLLGTAGSVPEAPNDGVQYGRQALAWTPVAAAGGGTPSNTNPIMDGVAAPGVATAYSRGDHVHPSDTSRAPTANPTFTGTLTAQTASYSGAVTLQTTTGVDALILHNNSAGATTPLKSLRMSAAGVLNVYNAAAAAIFGLSDNGNLQIVGSMTTKQGGVDQFGDVYAIRNTTDGALVFGSGAAQYILVTGGGFNFTGGPIVSPALSGTPTAPTAAPGTNTTQVATTAYVDAAAALRAPIASPTFTGDPKAPTPTAGDNDTSIATTAFVTAAVAAGGGGAGAVRYDTAQSLTSAQIVQARQNIYAAPFDAMAFNNMAINARIDVAQEALGIPALVSGTPKYCVDGWESQFQYTAGGVTVQSGQSNVVSSIQAPVGFYNSLLMNLTVGTMSSIANGDHLLVRQKIEGNRIMRLAWGTANAQPLAYAMMVQSSAAGIAFLKFSNAARTRCYYVEITLAVGTNFISGSIPGDTTASSSNWAIDNSIGLQVEIFFNGKSAAPVAPGAWTATNTTQTTNSQNLVTALNAYALVTGLWLAPGTQAPTLAALPLLMRPYDLELPLCQRHFCQLSGPNGTAFAAGMCYSTTLALLALNFPMQMRIAPALAVSALADLNILSGAAQGVPTALAASFISQTSTRLDATMSGLTAGFGAMLSSATATAALRFNARM